MKWALTISIVKQTIPFLVTYQRLSFMFHSRSQQLHQLSITPVQNLHLLHFSQITDVFMLVQRTYFDYTCRILLVSWFYLDDDFENLMPFSVPGSGIMRYFQRRHQGRNRGSLSSHMNH